MAVGEDDFENPARVEFASVKVSHHRVNDADGVDPRYSRSFFDESSPLLYLH